MGRFLRSYRSKLNLRSLHTVRDRLLGFFDVFCWFSSFQIRHFFSFFWTSNAVLAAFAYIVHAELSAGHDLISRYILFHLHAVSN